MPRVCKPRRRKGRKAHHAHAAPKRRRARRGHKHHAHRKSRKRVLAGRKAAQTRSRRRHAKSHPQLHGGYDPRYDTEASESPRRRRRKGKRKAHRKHHRAHARRRNPIPNPLPNPRHHRRHRRHHHFMYRNPLSNPGEIIAGLFGVGAGFVLADFADRMMATHALGGTAGAYTDSPAAGQIYDSEAPMLPIWTSPMRMGVAALMIFAPGFASRFIPSAKLKAFLQLAAYGAGAKVGGKVLTDVIATFGASNGSPVQNFALRAYGPEVAASARLAQVTAGGGTISPMTGTTGQPTQQPAGFFAGVPRGQLSAPTTAHRNIGSARRGMGDPNCGCGGTCNQCSQPISSDPVAQGNAAFDGQPTNGIFPFSTSWNPYDPCNEGNPDCPPLRVTQPQPQPMNALPPNLAPPTPPTGPTVIVSPPIPMPGGGPIMPGSPQMPSGAANSSPATPAPPIPYSNVPMIPSAPTGYVNTVPSNQPR